MKINQNGNIEISVEDFEKIIEKTYKEAASDIFNDLIEDDSTVLKKQLEKLLTTKSKKHWEESIAKNQTLCIDESNYKVHK